MLLNKGQDAITPIALPNGIKVVRFFSDQPAQLAVDTRERQASDQAEPQQGQRTRGDRTR